MAKTFTFSVSASPAKTAITVQGWTNLLELQEDPSVAGYPTTDFLVYRPSATDLPVRYTAGTTFPISTQTGPFYPGQILGYISGVGGSTTFAQVEQGLN